MIRIFRLAGALLLLCASIVLFVFLNMQIGKALQTASSAHADASSAGEQDLFGRRLQAFLQDTSASRIELESYVVKDTTAITIIDEIDAAAARNHVEATITSVGPSSSGLWKYHEPLEVILSAKGTLQNIAAFATELESFPSASHVSNMTAEASDKGQWFGSFTLTFVKEKDAAAVKI